ncbi:MAG: hypothetical protein J7J25_02765 [Candidatus Omnitrophica bacterium]|nr:hypothetical protein [Candidatus Omnitrophota bacterium]
MKLLFFFSVFSFKGQILASEKVELPSVFILSRLAGYIDAPPRFWRSGIKISF